MENSIGYSASADKFLGATFYAARPQSSFKNIGDSVAYKNYPAGSLIGIVYSYIVRDGNVWWMFREPNGAFFYVKHVPGNFVETDEIKAIEQGDIDAAELEKERAEIAAKGAFVYYFEKYGKIVLITGVALFGASILLKNSDKVKNLFSK